MDVTRNPWLWEADFLGLPVNSEMKADLSDFCRLPTIDSQMPVTLVHGNTWNEFTISCVNCDAPGTGEHLRGRLTLHTPSILDVVAITYCKKCALLSPAHFRVVATAGRPEQMSWKTGNSWGTGQILFQTSPWQTLIDYLKNFWRSF